MDKKHFWNWREGAGDGAPRELIIDGPIAESSWFDDEVTPETFRRELNAAQGDVVIWLNSPGGDCFAASRIYTMLREYPGSVTVKIDGMAASAATVLAMGANRVYMSPTSSFFIHNPYTWADGEAEQMRQAAQMLDEVKESIMNAYQLKTGLSRARISHLMDNSTMMNPRMAMELGFIDGILYDDGQEGPEDRAFEYSISAPMNCLIEYVKRHTGDAPQDGAPGGATRLELSNRLMKIMN